MSRKIVSTFINRNPRNLELLRLQRKPSGYDFERNREVRNYIYKAVFRTTKNHSEGRIVHYESGTILTASTKEKQINDQLVSATDANAAINVARVLADRCLKSGIHECLAGTYKNDPNKNHLTDLFFEALGQSGIKLQEPPMIPQSFLNDPQFVSDPFLVRHTREDKVDELMIELEKNKKLF
uniref:Large ribosomal subunit protein uL18m n=1 Tax=Acrobeloides nanus TaxID=290746 RepID=A0A914BUB5_9BILA